MTPTFFQNIFSVDLSFSKWLQDSPLKTYETFFWFVTTLGNLIPMALLLSSTVLALYFFKHQKAAKYLFWATSLGVTFSTILKYLIGRPRPTSDQVRVFLNMNDYSFPSSHCLEFVIFFGFLYFYLNSQKKQNLLGNIAKFVLVILIISIGFSRIYLGVHWLTDCLAGYLLGYLILKATIKQYQKK